MREVVHARGHEHVTASHASTFEVTSDDYLTPAGDCILAVDADHTPADFDEAFVGACRDRSARIVVTLETTDDTGTVTHRERVTGQGHPELTFESDRSLVWRTSEYVDDRTVAVGMERAAAELDRSLVHALAGGAGLRVTLTVEPP